MTKKARVFLSYARSDGSIACDFFYKALENAGYDPWRDIEDLPGGDPWEQRIQNTIRAADIVLLFLTAGAIASENVQKEWETAIRFQKRVVPLLVTAVTVPDELRRYNYMDIQSPADCQLGPSNVQKILETEQTELRTSFDKLRARISAEIASGAKQKYLEGFVESCSTMLDALPPPLPPEVMHMLFSLLSTLIDELGAEKDITGLVESMATGGYTAPGWEQEGVYKLRIADMSQILKKVRDAIPTTPVDVVVVAMTRAEAEDLESGQAFADLPAEWLQNFKSIRPTLAADWLDRYGATAEDWKPFPGEGNIATLIRSELQSLSQNLRTPLRYSFVEVHDLALPQRRQKLLELRAGGCLVVMDAVSSWHPKLHAAFRSTSLDVSPSTLVVRVAPDETLDNVLTKVGFLLHEWLICDFFHRADLDKDEKCETITQVKYFKKWIYNRLRDVAPSAAAQRSDLRPYINNLGG